MSTINKFDYSLFIKRFQGIIYSWLHTMSAVTWSRSLHMWSAHRGTLHPVT